MDAAKQIVSGYADGSTPIRSDDFANARGSLASGLVEGEKTRSQALFGAWRRALLNQDSDRNRQLIKAVGSVSERDALDAIRTWVAPLFDDACACTAIACAPAKVETLRATLLDNKRLAASPGCMMIRRWRPWSGENRSCPWRRRSGSWLLGHLRRSRC